MALMLNAVFTENGTPKTGLSNTVIYIYDLADDSLAVNGDAVSEVAVGGYKYNFTTYDASKDYYVVFDSVDLTGHERYAYMSIRNTDDYKADVSAITTHLTDIKGAGWVDENLVTIDTIVDTIKLKTDNLPIDPADQSLLADAISSAESNIRGADSDDLKSLSDQADRILGLSNENVYIDNAVFDSFGNMSSARLRVYSVAGSVGTDNDVLATYTITAVGTDFGQFSSWKQVKQ